MSLVMLIKFVINFKNVTQCSCVIFPNLIVSKCKGITRNHFSWKFQTCRPSNKYAHYAYLIIKISSQIEFVIDLSVVCASSANAITMHKQKFFCDKSVMLIGFSISVNCNKLSFFGKKQAASQNIEE